jgi:hypothetical protein
VNTTIENNKLVNDVTKPSAMLHAKRQAKHARCARSLSLQNKFGINPISVRDKFSTGTKQQRDKDMYSMSCIMISPQLMLSLKSSMTESVLHLWLELFAFLEHSLTQKQARHVFVEQLFF